MRNTRHPIKECHEMPPLFKDVLSVEEYVLGCMHDSFRSPLLEKKGKKFFSIKINTTEYYKIEGRRPFTF